MNILRVFILRYGFHFNVDLETTNWMFKFIEGLNFSKLYVYIILAFSFSRLLASEQKRAARSCVEWKSKIHICFFSMVY